MTKCRRIFRSRERKTRRWWIAGVFLVVAAVLATASAEATQRDYAHVYRHVSAIVLDIRFHDPDGVLDADVAQTMRRNARDYLVRALGAIRPDITIVERNLAPQHRGLAAERRLETIIRVSIGRDGPSGTVGAGTVVGIESVLKNCHWQTETRQSANGVWRGTRTALFEGNDGQTIGSAVAAEVRKQVKAEIVEAYQRNPRDF